MPPIRIGNSGKNVPDSRLERVAEAEEDLVPLTDR